MRLFHPFVACLVGYVSMAGILPAEETSLGEITDASFIEQLEQLRKTTLQERGRERLVADFEKLIAGDPDHPQVSIAMKRVGDLYQRSDSGIGLEADVEKSLVWYSRAAEAAPMGSQEWYDACLQAVHLLQNQIQTEDALAESRALLEAMARDADSAESRVRAEYFLIKQSMREKNAEGIERHAQNILDWSAADGELSEEDRQSIQGLKYAAAVELMGCAVQAATADGLATDRMRGTKEQRSAYVLSIAQQYPLPGVQEQAEQTLASIAAQPIPPAPPATYPMTARTGSWRLLVLVNCVLIAAFVVVIVVRRRSGTLGRT